MEHEIPFGNSNRENGTTFLDFPLFLGIFQWDEPTKRVPFTAEPEIPEILSKWKAPLETSWKFLKILASPKIFFVCVRISYFPTSTFNLQPSTLAFSLKGQWQGALSIYSKFPEFPVRR